MGSRRVTNIKGLGWPNNTASGKADIIPCLEGAMTQGGRQSGWTNRYRMTPRDTRTRQAEPLTIEMPVQDMQINAVGQAHNPAAGQRFCQGRREAQRNRERPWSKAREMEAPVNKVLTTCPVGAEKDRHESLVTPGDWWRGGCALRTQWSGAAVVPFLGRAPQTPQQSSNLNLHSCAQEP